MAPRLALTNRRDDVRLLPLGGSDVAAPVRRILLAHPQDRAATPAVQAMTRTLHSAATRFTGQRLDRAQLGSVRRAK